MLPYIVLVATDALTLILDLFRQACSVSVQDYDVVKELLKSAYICQSYYYKNNSGTDLSGTLRRTFLKDRTLICYCRRFVDYS